MFRLSFGPKSFVVVSDAAIARHILFTNAANYTKGVLSEILDFVMGQGGLPMHATELMDGRALDEGHVPDTDAYLRLARADSG